MGTDLVSPFRDDFGSVAEFKRNYSVNIPQDIAKMLGGYQVLKKWLSYREHKILTRPLNLKEVQHFYNTARRIARILGMESRG